MFSYYYKGYGKTFILYTEKENDLKVLKATDENYVDNLVKCIQNGDHVILENISETVDDIVGKNHFGTWNRLASAFLRFYKTYMSWLSFFGTIQFLLLNQKKVHILIKCTN